MHAQRSQQLAVKLASNANLPGADDLYVWQYNQQSAAGKYAEAAKIAASSPRVCCMCSQRKISRR